MKSALIKKIVLVLVALALVTALFACSQRETPITDDNVVIGSDDGVVEERRETVAVTKDEASKALKEAVDNYSTQYTQSVSDDPEWYVVDLTLTYNYEYFWLDSTEKYDTSSSFTVVFKANLHMKDNSQSQLYFQIRNSNGVPVFCIYYVENYAYFVIGTQRFYTAELNLSTIGAMIYDLLGSSGIDITKILASVALGSGSGIPTLDGILPMLGMIAFIEPSYITSYEQNEDGEFTMRDISFTIQLNQLLNMLSGSGIPIAGGISFGTIWNLVGLNLDPVLGQFLGFTVAELGEKKWPEMNALYSAVTQRQLITTVDNTGLELQEYGYVMQGVSINIDTLNDVDAQREKYAYTEPADMGEDEEPVEDYSVAIVLSPALLYASDDPIAINFANLNVNEEGRRSYYSEGGLGNIGLAGTLYVENDENGKLTINSILGNVFDLDLGALGEMPIDFPYAARYEFQLDLKVALDFFNGADTTAEITINYNGSPLIRIYLGDNVLYLNFENLQGASGQILPNLKIPGFNINMMLDGLFLDMIKPYLDPSYVPSANAASGASNASGAVNADGDSGSSVDVMAILKLILDNFNFPGREEYLYNEDGTVMTDENGDPIPNTWDISMILDNEALAELIGMITPVNGVFGDDLNVGLYFNQLDPLNTIEIKAELTDTVRFGITLDEITYLKEPEWDNYEMVDTEAKRNAYTSLQVTLSDNGIFGISHKEFSLEMAGDVTLGMEATEEGLDLSGLIGAFVDNLLLSIGVEQTKYLELAYKIEANIDILNLSAIQLRLLLYNRESDVNYLAVIYEGSEDTIYIDLSLLDNLKDQIPGLNSLATMPRLKYENLGLKETLSGLDIVGLLGSLLYPSDSGASGAQNGITVDTSDPSFVYNAFATVNKALLYNEYLVRMASAGNLFRPSEEIEDAYYAEGDTSEGGIDILGLIGGALDRVVIDKVTGTLTVYVAANVLTTVLGMLITELPADADLPKVNAFAEIHLVNIDFGDGYPENGYLRVYLALLDSGNEEIEAISVELDILKDIQLKAEANGTIWDVGNDDVGYKESFQTIQEFLDGLIIGLKVNGEFSLTVDNKLDENGDPIPVYDENGEIVYDENGEIVYEKVESYVNDYLNGLLGGLIEGIGLLVDTSEFSVRLGFEIVAKISLAGVLKLDGSEGADPISTLLGSSELKIRLYDLERKNDDGSYVDILGLYLIDGNLYIDLSYFGMPNIGVSNVAKLIDDITAITSSPTPDPGNAPARNLLNLQNNAYYANVANPEAVALQVVLSPEALSVSLTKDAIAGLLGLFLTSELPIEIQDTDLALGFGKEGITLDLTTGVEIFNLHIGAGDLLLVVDNFEYNDETGIFGLPSDSVLVTDPAFTVTLPAGKEFFLTEDGMPTNIYVELGGGVGLTSDPVAGSAANTIDLAPALSGLLGDIELNALIEFLGIVDAQLFFNIQASVNLEEIIDIAQNGFDFAKIKETAAKITFETYASDDPNDIDIATGERNRKAVISL